jgi:hypothetical protein
MDSDRWADNTVGMLMQILTAVESSSSCDKQSDRYDFLRASLELLAKLEASLIRSQKAMLSRNISVIDHETCVQRRLQQALAQLWTCSVASTQKSNSLCSNLPRLRPSLPPELYSAQVRVQYLAQVQLALLGRARRSLHILTYLMKGPCAGYGPPTGMNASPPSISGQPGNRTERDSSCRA